MEHFRRLHGLESEFDEKQHSTEVTFPSIAAPSNVSRRSLELPSFKKTVARRQSLDPSSLVKKQPPGPQVVPIAAVQCPLCARTVIPANIMQHWTKHGRHPASLRVLAQPEQKMVSLKQLFTFIFKCDAPGCHSWVGSNVSDNDCISKVREHWSRAHNLKCLPKSSQVRVEKYSYEFHLSNSLTSGD